MSGRKIRNLHDPRKNGVPETHGRMKKRSRTMFVVSPVTENWEVPSHQGDSVVGCENDAS